MAHDDRADTRPGIADPGEETEHSETIDTDAWEPAASEEIDVAVSDETSSTTESEPKGEPETVAGIALAPDETVEHDFRPSWTAWTKSLLFVWLIVPLLYAWFKRRQTRYIITSDRVIIKEGLVANQTTEVPHAHLHQIETKAGFLERIVGKGTIQIDTAHQESINLEAVPNSKSVANTIRQHC